MYVYIYIYVSTSASREGTSGMRQLLSKYERQGPGAASQFKHISASLILMSPPTCLF